MPKPEIRATEVGEYIRHRSCERRFKLDINHRALAKRLPFAERLFNTLDPVLQEAGRERENSWEESLSDDGIADLTGYRGKAPDANQTPWADFRRLLESVVAGQSSYGREVEIAAEIDAIRVEGRVDFILLLWVAGRPILRLVECKASRRDRTYHRIQVALYRLIVQKLLREAPLSIGGVLVRPEDVQCVVARIDEATNESHQILALPPLPDLEMQEDDLRRLAAETGPLVRIANAPLDELNSASMRSATAASSVSTAFGAARRRGLELWYQPVRCSRASDQRTGRSTRWLISTSRQLLAVVRTDPGFRRTSPSLSAPRRVKTLVGGGEPDEYEVSSCRTRAMLSFRPMRPGTTPRPNLFSCRLRLCGESPRGFVRARYFQ